MEHRNPAKVFALVVGGVLVVAGVIGFFYESQFTSDESVRDAVLGILDVNGWHNVVHIATGLLGIAAFAAGVGPSRSYALGLGVVYLAVAAWGFVLGDGESILSIVPVNTEDNVLHALIALTGLTTWFASASEGRVAPATR